MTDEEIEIVAQELAKVGGTSWYPGRQHGGMVRVVSDRYRDQARLIIEAFDRLHVCGAIVFSSAARRPPATLSRQTPP
ncbi:hypothetical protein [Microvirga antarctica]|uniref:hypothetical protein n=1 Tax=Microvirga antarctica TaxID=2819233 RepID=UPI001B314059|nr:hypothetical protein [Microvirga antarctica]